MGGPDNENLTPRKIVARKYFNTKISRSTDFQKWPQSPCNTSPLHVHHKMASESLQHKPPACPPQNGLRVPATQTPCMSTTLILSFLFKESVQPLPIASYPQAPYRGFIELITRMHARTVDTGRAFPSHDNAPGYERGYPSLTSYPGLPPRLYLAAVEKRLRSRGEKSFSTAVG